MHQEELTHILACMHAQGGNGAMRSNPMPGSRRGRGQQPGGPPRPPPRSTTLDVNGIPLNSPDAVPWTTATDAINDWGAGWGGKCAQAGQCKAAA
eukprot:1159804-Pelagomonas_calceolata.AAC.3